jgi:hypothetical protein
MQRDLVSQFNLTLEYSAPWEVSSEGVVLRTALATNGGAYIAAPGNLQAITNWSHMFRYRHLGSSDGFAVSSAFQYNSDQTSKWQVFNSGGTPTYRVANGTAYTDTAGTYTIGDGLWHTVVMTCTDAGVLNVWVDGKTDIVNAATGRVPYTAGTQTFYLGHRVSNGLRVNAEFSVAAIWGAVLPAAVAVSLCVPETRWDLLWQRKRAYIFMGQGATGGATTNRRRRTLIFGGRH